MFENTIKFEVKNKKADISIGMTGISKEKVKRTNIEGERKKRLIFLEIKLYY